MIPERVKDEGLKNAYEDADKHNWTKEELDAYDYVLMREQDDRGRWTLATKKELKKEKEAIVKKSLNLGLTLDVIAEITGLTIEQVEKLQRNRSN